MRPSAFSDRNLQIYDRYKAGESPQALADAYGIGPTRVRQIVNRVGPSLERQGLGDGLNRFQQFHEFRRKAEMLEVAHKTLDTLRDENERLRARNEVLEARLKQIHLLCD